MTYIIGYPHEKADNMLATLDQARSEAERIAAVLREGHPEVNADRSARPKALKRVSAW